MLKVVLAGLMTKNVKFTEQSKINGAAGPYYDSAYFLLSRDPY